MNDEVYKKKCLDFFGGKFFIFNLPTTFHGVMLDATTNLGLIGSVLTFISIKQSGMTVIFGDVLK